MATVPTVPTFPAGTVVTSAALNSVIEAGEWLLGVDSGDRPSWVLQNTGGGSIAASASNVAIVWDTRVSDNDGVFPTVGQGAVTIQTPGLYTVDWSVPLAGNTTSTEIMAWLTVATTANNPYNPSTGYQIQATGQTGNGNCILTGGGMVGIWLYTGDTLSVRVTADSTALTYQTGGRRLPSFSGMWVSALWLLYRLHLRSLTARIRHSPS